MNRLLNWLEQMNHRLHGHLLVTVLTKDGKDYSFYLSSIYTEDGKWTMDMVDGLPVDMPTKDCTVTITGA